MNHLLACMLVGASVTLAQEIWQPPMNATWQWQLQFNVNTSFDVDMYDVDLFDVETETFDEIRAKGSVVVCYFSAGTREDWRDDADDFPEAALGEPLGDWEGEVWIDVNNEAVRDIMAARIALAAEKGCDGVEPDNVQVYAEAIWGTNTGVSVTADEQLDYNMFLATEGYLTSFIAAGKAVFHAEYEKNLTFCAEANAMGMSSILKAYDLGPARCSCQDPSTNYQCDLLLDEGISSYSSTSSSTNAEIEEREIWQPPVNTTWQWQLQFQVNTSFDVDMYDVDLFDFSAGTREDWRDDADDFPEAALGEPLGDWEGEVWIDVNNEVYAEAIWGADTGVSVTADEQLDYNMFLATEAHGHNLSIGLKNDLDHLTDLEPFFDWAINESCFEYNECEGYSTSFIAAGKAVFHAEYEKNLTFCTEANAMGMSSILKAYDLGPARCSCQDPSTNYQCDLLLDEGISSYSGPSSSTPSSIDTEAPTAPPTGRATPAPTEENVDDRETAGDSSARREKASSWIGVVAAGATAAAFGAMLA
eukprot:g10683.t1